MRTLLLALLLAAAAAPASSQPAPGSAPSAQAAYAERRALLEADQRCTLFAPDVRAALQGGADQARGALLRSGWTAARVGELEQAAVRAARGRACGDARTAAAADRARRGYASWSRAHAMEFPGSERGWSARRTPDPQEQWVLKQTIAAPRAAVFGLREISGAQEVTLLLRLDARSTAPGLVQLAFRDSARAPQSQMDVPGRTARGLAAGRPSPAATRTVLAAARRVETADGERRALYAFPGDVLPAVAALDPRETVEIRLGDGRQPLLLEVGDLAAARAFLAAGR